MISAIPTGSLVLVTGINGYLGSHVADQLLQAGFLVRGTTRALSKAAPLKKLWDEKYGPDKVDLVVVEDMAVPGAFDEAVQGVSGVAHVASDMSFSPDPDKVIPGVLAGINSILTSASHSPTVKRFVYTSSSTALTKPRPNEKFHISTTLWNESDIVEAQAPPPYEDAHAWPVYGASKSLAEKELWKFVENKKPHFVANAILPNVNFGSILVKGMPSSTADFVTALYNGDTKPLERLLPQYFVDVQDTGRLHVAALIDPDVQNERIIAFTTAFNANDILRILRKLRPDRSKIFPADFVDDNWRDISTVDNKRGAELLKKLFRREGWTGLEDSLKNNIAGL